MLDFSWSEFMVVIVVAVLAVGPKQLPEVLHGLGKIFRRVQYMRYAVTKQFDDFMDQSDLRELRDHTRLISPELFDAAKTDEAGADEDVMMHGPSPNPAVIEPPENAMHLITPPNSESEKP